MWIEELKNGKFKAVERYEDPLTGKPKKMSVVIEKNTASSRKQAQETLNEKITSLLASSYAPILQDKLTLEQLATFYLKAQERTVKSSTYTRNKFAIKKILELLGEDTLCNRLTAGYIKERFNENAKPSTINERIKRFKAMMRWGYENDYLDDIRFIDKVKPVEDKAKADKLRSKYLEGEELQELLDGMKLEQWKMVTQFLALSGLRFGECAALTVNDLDMKNKTIHVTKTYDTINKVVTTPKTDNSIRDVFMQAELYAFCKSAITYHKKAELQYGYRSKLLFCDINGGYIEYYAYNKYLKENAKNILGRNITTHVMRHTHTSLMAEAGVPLEVISRRLGHSDSKTTRDIYLHITQKQKEKDNQAIEQIQLLK